MRRLQSLCGYRETKHLGGYRVVAFGEPLTSSSRERRRSGLEAVLHQSLDLKRSSAPRPRHRKNINHKGRHRWQRLI